MRLQLIYITFEVGENLIKSLLLTLKPPVRVSLQSKNLLDAPLAIDELVTSRPSTPPWPACADLLINTNSSAWVGLCYRVGKQYQDIVQGFFYDLSTAVVRYNDMTSDESRRLYSEFGYETHWVEVRWANILADRVEVSQLDSGYWYYINQAQILAYDEPYIFGLEDIDEVLEKYGLVFPDLSFFPQFQPQFMT